MRTSPVHAGFLFPSEIVVHPFRFAVRALEAAALVALAATALPSFAAGEGEAIADLGGTTIALRAFERTPEFKAHRRVIGTLSNMPEFRAAFGCAAGDKMVRAQRCRIW